MTDKIGGALEWLWWAVTAPFVLAYLKIDRWVFWRIWTPILIRRWKRRYSR